MPKIRKKSVFRCRPPKTDFRFLIYTPKTKIKVPVFNAYKVIKFPF